MHARLAYAILTCEQRGRSTEKAVADLLDNESLEMPFEDNVAQMGHARIALLEVATMIKASLREQWKAIDSVLVARSLPSRGVDDEFGGGEDLLALRPAFEASRTKMKVATAAAYKATHGPDITSAGGDAMRAVLEFAKSRQRPLKTLCTTRSLGWGEV